MGATAGLKHPSTTKDLLPLKLGDRAALMRFEVEVDYRVSNLWLAFRLKSTRGLPRRTKATNKTVLHIGESIWISR